MYLSKEKVKFQVVMKTDRNYFIKREVSVNVIESNKVNFLCGKQTLKEQKTVFDFDDSKLGYK